MTLREAIGQYIAWRRAQGARFQSQAYALRRYCRRVGDAVDCDAVRSDQVSSFLASGTPASSNRVFLYCTLASFYRYAITRSLATRSPLPVEAPKAPPSAPPYIYSRDELRRLLDAVKIYRKRVNQLEPHTFRALLLVLYGAGLRRGEALSLTLADIDLRAAVLTVRETKFDKTRLIPPGPQLARAMQEYAAQRMACGASQAHEAPFFVNRDGTPLAARTVSKAFVQLRRVRTTRASPCWARAGRHACARSCGNPRGRSRILWRDATPKRRSSSTVSGARSPAPAFVNWSSVVQRKPPHASRR